MPHRTQWLVAIGALIGLTAGTESFAQPTVRDHRDPATPPAASANDRRAPRPPGAAPSEAPPAPRAETPTPRPGFVWIPGRWDWQGTWVWRAGRLERERAGKKWREGRWDRQHDQWAYHDGDWIDAGAASPADDYPRAAPPPPREERAAPRAGFLWVAGRWNWRAGTWDWVAGHWERERAGQKWREGRWDKQGDRWAYVEGTWGAGAMPGSDRPRHAPPPPREERAAPRAGFVFLPGRWDWRNDQWAWVDGRWERERAGKQWRQERWEQRDGAYALIDGEWIDLAAPPTGGAAPDGRRERRREWRLDRPVVSSYWPTKGNATGRIVIRGRNFPADTQVLWGGTPIRGVKVAPEEIVVAVPPGATSGMLWLRTGGGRALAVGEFEVADYDAVAETKRLAEASRKRAEQAWADRQKQLARDRTARMAALDRYHRERAETREQRRNAGLNEIRAKWAGAFLSDLDTQAELTLHAQRGAELERMREMAELSDNGRLVVRIGVAQSREDQRHEGRMAGLQGAFGRKP